MSKHQKRSEPLPGSSDFPEEQESQASGATPPSPSEPGTPANASLEDSLKEQIAKAAENWDKFLRLSADFENYKKRVAKEKSETAKYASSALLSSLLNVMDNFEMALAASAQATDDNSQALRTGIGMIFNQLKSVLQEAGLREIDASGGRFDPNQHEAVSQQETETVPEGHVVQQLRKGYLLHDRLLRPASVIVAKNPAMARNSLAATQADSSGNA